ncbi:MAG: zinc-binding protein [Clostridiales bacterium]|nr:zinc-binding protein [Clostridiales bacterium]
MYQDKELVCRDCGASFTFTAGEQEFYAEKGFQNEPVRCKPCRDARKANRRGDGTRREMYDAVCAECGGPARVPFVPRDDRPVYCSDCYQAKRQISNA